MDLFFPGRKLISFHKHFLSPALEPQVSLRLPCSPASSGPGMTPGARATQATPKASGWAGQSPFSGAEHRDTAGKLGQLASGLQPGHKNAGSGHHRAEGMAVPNKVIVTKNAHIPKTQAQAWASADFQSLRPGRRCGDGRRDCVSRKRRKMFTRSKVRSAHHLTSHIPAPSGLQTPFHTHTPFNDLSFVMRLAMYFLERSDDSQLSGPGSGVPDR